MKVTSTCCHFSLNNVPVTYLVYLHDVPQRLPILCCLFWLCPTILVTTQYAWIGYFITLVLCISTTNTPHISHLMTACFLHLLPLCSSVFSTCSFKSSSPPSGNVSCLLTVLPHQWWGPAWDPGLVHQHTGHTGTLQEAFCWHWQSGVHWGEHLDYCHNVAGKRGGSP